MKGNQKRLLPICGEVAVEDKGVEARMFLLDSDVLIHALRGNLKVVERMKASSEMPKALSAISYGELLYGAAKSDRRQENLARVRRIAEIFPVLEVTSAVVETFAAIKVSLESKGTRIDDFDLLIASTALLHNYTLVTGNTKHFQNIPGLDMVNWIR